jgi:hypothetical protein
MTSLRCPFLPVFPVVSLALHSCKPKQYGSPGKKPLAPSVKKAGRLLLRHGGNSQKAEASTGR